MSNVDKCWLLCDVDSSRNRRDRTFNHFDFENLMDFNWPLLLFRDVLAETKLYWDARAPVLERCYSTSLLRYYVTGFLLRRRYFMTSLVCVKSMPLGDRRGMSRALVSRRRCFGIKRSTYNVRIFYFCHVKRNFLCSTSLQRRISYTRS